MVETCRKKWPIRQTTPSVVANCVLACLCVEIEERCNDRSFQNIGKMKGGSSGV